MGKLPTLLKSFGISLRVKGPASLAVSILGFGAAFLPVLLARRLQALTDSLQSLMRHNGDYHAAMSVFAGLAAIYALQLLFSNLQAYMNNLDTLRIFRYIKRTIMRHKCDVAYKYIENYDDFQKRIAFAEEFAGRQVAASIRSIVDILQAAVSLTFVSVALWQVHPVIVPALLITSIPAAVLSYLQQDETFRGRAKWFEEGRLAIHCFITLSGRASLDALQEIKHFALFDYLKARWRAIADDYVGQKNRVMAKHVKYNAVADFLRSAVYVAILLIAARQIYRNPALGLGTFTLVFALSKQMQAATGEGLVNLMLLAQSIPYMREFFYLESLEREEQSGGAAIKNGGISFEHVTFAYPNAERQVLKDVSVEIHAGEKIAVVGENGSGKSTFISLLCGMFEAQAGHVDIGGVPVAGSASVRDAISVVFQDFARYEATLRDNITVSDSRRPFHDGEIMELLEKINVADVVQEQPRGLDELVGSFSDKANDLSGGQWQKISLARAAYRKDARIMILDEPTSALDPVAEAQLYRNFAQLTEDKTTILISHRLGITAVVDRILVFHDGQIVEDGSHQQLLERNGHYARMYRAQAQWYA